MYCSKCGNKVEDNQKFCNKCGSKLENSTQKSVTNNKWKKYVLFSVIGFIASIILGNVFNAIDIEVGKYIAMIVLCVSSGGGIISLLGYFISKKGTTDKVPNWIIVIVGILIALMSAFLISKAIETSQARTEELNRQKAIEDLKSNSEKTQVEKALDDLSDFMNKRKSQ